MLGSQIKKRSKRYILAPHTKLKAIAAGLTWRIGITKKILISGGYNFWVRYNENQIFSKPNFSFEAFVKGREEKSEAEIIRNFLRQNFNIPNEAIFVEELSATTEESAAILKILLKRSTFSFVKKIGILTTHSHMRKALQAFESVGLKVEPLYAEEIVRHYQERRQK